jgi:hypothetical protein
MAISAKQQRAIAALMTEPTIDAAAKTAGVHRATMFRWLNDATFCAELRRSADDAIAATVRRLTTLSASAVDVMRDAMGNDMPIGVRLRAADTVLARLFSLRELHDLADRVTALEERHEQTNGTNQTTGR